MHSNDEKYVSKNETGFDAKRSRLHWHFKQASFVIEAYFFFLVFSSIECERRIETMKKGMLERLSNMPFSVGGEENHLFFIEEVEVFANKFFAVVYGCRWIRRRNVFARSCH